MAISSTALSPREFRIAIQPQTALGTALTNGMLELNVDSISHGTLGGVNSYDVKSGGGRILQDEHYFIKIQIIFPKYLSLEYILRILVLQCLRT